MADGFVLLNYTFHVIENSLQSTARATPRAYLVDLLWVPLGRAEHSLALLRAVPTGLGEEFEEDVGAGSQCALHQLDIGQLMREDDQEGDGPFHGGPLLVALLKKGKLSLAMVPEPDSVFAFEGNKPY